MGTLSPRTALLFASLLLAGCPSSRRPEVARLDAVAPNAVKAGREAELAIVGSGFSERVRVDLDDSSAAVTEGYRLLLFGERTLELTGVQFVSAEQLTATLPADVPAGSYQARLIDGWSREVEGVAALEVAEKLCSDKTECDDGLSCTNDVCSGGGCKQVVNGGACLIGGACVAAGSANGPCEVCDASRSTTSWSPRAAGDACDDGVLCTVNDACDGAGRCGGTAACAAPPTACTEPVGACLQTGACQYTARAAGAACDDGNSCTAGTTCDSAGACTGGSFVCGSVGPRACLTLSATAVAPLSSVTFDASCSTDDATGLTARFDFEGDGVFDTAFGALTASHSFPSSGFFSPTVEVRDADDGRGLASAMLAVVNPAMQVVVTTAQDELNGSVTPASPGGSGLSLREAIAYVNSLNAARTITFAAPMTIVTTSELPQLSPPNAAIWGRRGVVVDFDQKNQPGVPCMIGDGAGQRFAWLELKGCVAHAVAMKGLDAQVAHCTFDGTAVGQSAKFSIAGRFGPGNVVRNFQSSSAFQVKDANVLVEGNTFQGNEVDVEVLTDSDNTRIRFNSFIDTTDTSIEIPQGCSGSQVAFNTFVNAPVAVETSSATGTDVAVVNNIFKDVGCALTGTRAGYAQVGPNLVHPATPPTCFESESGAAVVVGDPSFVNAAAGDYRLKPGSPAINTASDIGLDTNGTLPGNFHGAAPDFGAYEALY